MSGKKSELERASAGPIRAVLTSGPADGIEVADPGDGKIRWFDGGGETQHIYKRQTKPDDEGRAVFAYLGEYSDGVTAFQGVPEEPDHAARPDTDPNITTTDSMGASKPAQASKASKK